MFAALVGCSTNGGAPADDDDVMQGDGGPGVTADNAADYAAEVLITGVIATTTANPVPYDTGPANPSCAYAGAKTTELAGQTASAIRFYGCDDGYGKVVDGQLRFTDEGATFAVDAALTILSGATMFVTRGNYALVAHPNDVAIDDLQITGDAINVSVLDQAVSRDEVTLSAFDIRASSVIVLDHGPLRTTTATYTLATARLHDQLHVTTREPLEHDFVTKHPQRGALTVTGAGDSRLEITIHGAEDWTLDPGQIELRVARGAGEPSASIWVRWDDLVKLTRRAPSM